VQSAVSDAWDRLSSETLDELADYEGYQRDFRNLFGFDVAGIDYSQPTELNRHI
jgi:enoyl-[acyl-carrier protein] reductase/trans-2-enoyl-CoA reductase (NAD+)